MVTETRRATARSVTGIAARRTTTGASILVGTASAVLLMIRLLIPRPVGVADSYDGERLMCHLNLDAHLARGAARLRDYVVWRYDHSSHASCTQHFIGSIELPKVPYQSSQLLIIQTGHWLTRLAGLAGALDLRAVGVECCVLIGGAIGLLFWALTCAPRYRFALCALLLAVVADASFIDYAISPFSEIAAIIGLLYVLPALVLMSQPGRRGAAGLVFLVVAGSFLVTAKEQYAVLAIPLITAVMVITVPRRHGLRLAAGATVVLLGCALGVVQSGDPRNHRLIRANFVTATLLATGSDPASDLRELGQPGWLAAVRGEPVWCSPTEKLRSAEYDTVLSNASFGRIAGFLVDHPDRVPSILTAAADDFYQPRPESTLCSGHTGRANVPLLASYGHAADMGPHAIDHRFDPVTTALGLLAGKGLVPLAILWTAPVAVAAFAQLRLRRGTFAQDSAAASSRRCVTQLATVLYFLAATAVAQFVLCAFADGIDTSKHLNLSIATTVAAWPVALTLALIAAAAGRTPADGVRPALSQSSVPEQKPQPECAAPPRDSADTAATSTPAEPR